MGSTNSTERLAIPLQDVSPPVIATSLSTSAPKPMSLLVKRSSAWRSTLQVVDTATDKHRFDIKSKTLSSRRTLQTPEGAALVSMKTKTLSSDCHVYDSADPDNICFDICVGRHLIHTEFRDQQSGRECRVVLGNAYDDVMVIYLEYGPLEELPKPTRDDVADGSRFQAIARIQRVKGKAFSEDQHILEVAAGVDITLMVLLWQVWKDQEDARQAAVVPVVSG